MLDVPASSHFRARQRPAAHKHAHRQHMLQGEGTQAGGRWAVSDTHQISSEDVHLDQAVAISAPSARRARPYITLRAGGRRPRQVGCRSSSQRRPRAVSRAAMVRRGRGGCVGGRGRCAACPEGDSRRPLARATQASPLVSGASRQVCTSFRLHHVRSALRRFRFPGNLPPERF